MQRVIISAVEQATHVRQRLPPTLLPWRDVVNSTSECDFWQVGGALTLRDIVTGQEFRVRCHSHELPTILSAVVLEVQLADDQIASRPSPLCLLGHPLPAQAPSPASFEYDDTCAAAERQLLGACTPSVDMAVPNLAQRLFLARYMPMSYTCAVVGWRGLFDRVSALLKQSPWMLFLEGYIDHQGLKQALLDYNLEAALFQRLGCSAMPEPLWWAHLIQAYARIDKRMALGGAPNIVGSDELTNSACRTLSALEVMQQLPNGAYLSKLQAKAFDIIKDVFAIYNKNGRKAAHAPSGVSILEALRHTDILVVDVLARYRQSISHELDSIMNNAFLVLSRHNNADQTEVRHRFEEALHSGRTRHPVVVIVDAHTWSTTDLTRSLLPLVGARQSLEQGRYPFTRSGVPFQLLFVYNSLEKSTAWMRGAVKCGALPPTVFYPRMHEAAASSSCPLYTALRDAVLTENNSNNLADVFRSTCKALLANNPDASDPEAKVCSLHEACPLRVCRALPSTDEGLPPEIAEQMAALRVAVHVHAENEIYTLLRTHTSTVTNIFLYPDAVSGTLPSPAAVCTAMCEADSVFLVAEPAERFPRLIDLFGP